jgi:hypothetical protein
MIRLEVGSSTNRSAVAAVVAGLICAALAVTALYIVATGNRLSGGLPFLPDALNQTIGRIAIGIGGILTGVLACLAFRDASRLLRDRS